MENLERTLRYGSEEEIWSLWYRREWVVPIFRYWLGRLSPSNAMDLLGRRSKATAALLTNHPNGYVRQAAFEALPPEGAVTLIVAIERCNDWVPVIRALARHTALTLIATASLEVLEEAVPSVYRLSRQQRGRQTGIVDAFFDRYGVRLDPFSRNRPSLSPSVARWLIQHKGIRTVEDVRAGLDHPDPIVQTMAAKAAIHYPETFSMLLNARSARVRRIGLDAAASVDLQTALSDPHAGVRNDARYLFGKADFAAHYRGLLPKAGAISGLGETGRQEDADLLRPYLDHPSADIRKRTLEAMGRLGGERVALDAKKMLRDPSRKVKTAAAQILARSTIAIEPEEIDLLDFSRAAWPLVNRLGRWPSAIFVAQHASTFPLCDAWLRRWALRYNRAPVPPNSGEAAELRQGIESSHAFIDVDTRTEVLDIVRVWERKQ